MEKRVRVDVGGTFTDFVLVDEYRNLIYTGMRLASSGDPSVAIAEGVERRLIACTGISLSSVGAAYCPTRGTCRSRIDLATA